MADPRFPRGTPTLLFSIIICRKLQENEKYWTAVRRASLWPPRSANAVSQIIQRLSILTPVCHVVFMRILSVVYCAYLRLRIDFRAPAVFLPSINARTVQFYGLRLERCQINGWLKRWYLVLISSWHICLVGFFQVTFEHKHFWEKLSNLNASFLYVIRIHCHSQSEHNGWFC